MEINLEVVSIEVVAAITVKRFPFGAPKRLQLFLPMECQSGDKIAGKFVVDSEFGERELVLLATVKSEAQLVNTLIRMIDKGLDLPMET